jgi:hypothetical protein
MSASDRRCSELLRWSRQAVVALLLICCNADCGWTKISLQDSFWLEKTRIINRVGMGKFSSVKFIELVPIENTSNYPRLCRAIPIEVDLRGAISQPNTTGSLFSGEQWMTGYLT